ncbi:MAG TPA: hypothetical protein EYP36_00590 [Calditrichaeota bacterium]|nr:hypothetical protein [Calditrichota bacterium]
MKKQIIHFVVLLLTAFLFWVGCVNPFAPSLTDSGDTQHLILSEQDTPEGVFTNFSYSYNFKDSLVYADLLDSSFLFISKNYATNPVTDLTWGRDVDIKTTVGLFRHFQTLNLKWEATIFERFLDDDSSKKEIKKRFQLTFDGGQEIPTINGDALFILLKKSRNKKPFWQITRWEDLSTF